MTVQNVNCVSAYFCDTRTIYVYNFAAPLNAMSLAVAQLMRMVIAKICCYAEPTIKLLVLLECAKFLGLRTIVGLVCLVPSCQRTCLRGYFVGPKCFLQGTLYVQNFFSLVFRGSNFFFSWIISQFKDPVFDCMRKSHSKSKFIYTPTAYSIPGQQSSVLFILERYFIY